jgi:methionine-S-sulfoxide reductase
MEELLRKIPGVIKTEVGYTGGSSEQPTYSQVSTGKTGHAEAVQITFDPKKITYSDILGWFFKIHDPTTENRQGNDIGTQYRSVIFVHSEAQRKVANDVKNAFATKWTKPIVTQVVDAQNFYPAEEYHQDYLQKNPNGYTCHYIRNL